MKVPVEKYFGIAPTNGIRYSNGPPAVPASWDLPATIQVAQSGTVGVRQYLLNGAGLTISVTSLPTGVTYDSENETLVGAASGTGSGTATFTATGGVEDTTTVALVAPASGYTPESGFTLSGTFAHGDTVTISAGSSVFGTHPLDVYFAGGAGNMLESDVGDGSPVTVSDGWEVQSTDASRTTTDDERGKVLTSTQTSSADNQFRRAVAECAPGAWHYASYWMKRNIAWRSSPTAAGQHKLIRFSDRVGLPSLVGVGIMHFTQTPEGIGTTNTYWYREINGAWNSNYITSQMPSYMYDYEYTQWVRVEAEIYATTLESGEQGVYNFTTRRIGSTPTRIVRDSLDESHAYLDASNRFSGILFQDYFGNGAGAGSVVVRDDFYFSSNSRARVEITDSGTWGSEQIAEIQEPTAWVGDEIQFKVNYGGMSSLVGKTLWVILDDGTATKIATFT